jgi:hypothetical protein
MGSESHKKKTTTTNKRAKDEILSSFRKMASIPSFVTKTTSSSLLMMALCSSDVPKLYEMTFEGKKMDTKISSTISTIQKRDRETVVSLEEWKEELLGEIDQKKWTDCQNLSEVKKFWEMCFASSSPPLSSNTTTTSINYLPTAVKAYLTLYTFGTAEVINSTDVPKRYRNKVSLDEYKKDKPRIDENQLSSIISYMFV